MTDEASLPLDRRVLLERVEGDLELLIAIIESFLSRLPHHLEEIGAAVRSRDARTLSQSAHALKGSVANFSLGPVYRISSRLEEIGKDGMPLERADSTEPTNPDPSSAAGSPVAGNEAETLMASLETSARELEVELRAVADDARSGRVLEDV